MISTKLVTINDSVQDMFDALTEAEVPVLESKMNLIPGLVASIQGIEYPTPISTDNLQTTSERTTAMLQIKEQIKTVVTNSGVQITNDLTTFGDCIRQISSPNTLVIEGPSVYTGNDFILHAYFNNTQVNATSWSITSGSNYADINQNGKVFVEPGTISSNITVSASYTHNNNTYTTTKQITVTYDNQLNIESSSTITGTQGNIIVKFNSDTVTENCTLTITNGSEHIVNRQISQTGEFDILNSGDITIRASYLGYVKNKTITLVYSTNSETTVIENNDGSITTETITETTDPITGEVTTETISTTVNKDGSTSSTNSTTTTAQDGSSYTRSEIVNSDGTSSETTSTTSAPDPNTGSTTTQSQTTNSDGTSSESEITNNTDGSFGGSIINYDENGEPTTRENVEGDTYGNVSIQEVLYDSNGNEIITGYNIDTSGNEDGEKNFNGNGVNTQFYGFDMTDGFVLDMHFTINFSQQPAGQDENHHQILTMKRSTPEPWYGFQLRQTGNNKYIVLGAQFSTGSNTNTQISPNYTQGGNTISEYHIQIVYDPTSPSNNFICRELISNTIVFQTSRVFPDIAELEYLTVCIGFGQDANGNPYRYSNIDVSNFQIVKLSKIETPVISCENNQVNITCATQGVEIYYRLNESGSFSQYTIPFSINATTIVEAYSTLSSRTTATVTETCRYTPPVLYPPVITCDGTHVTITCTTQGASIYYRLNGGNYTQYSSPIAIIADTVVDAYSTLDSQTSPIVTENCEYSIVIETPVIYCDGEYVSIACDTPSVTIWYQLDNSGTYMEYSDAFIINATTVVESYAELNGYTSQHATETCVYNPIILVSPVITCDGETVTITCATPNAVIYYNLDGGSYVQYTSPLQIIADTIVEAYSTIHGRVSSVVTENCIYNPKHDYSKDYLTFRVLTGGTIAWQAFGTGYTKTIEYSVNDGTWTSITAANTTPPTISVSENDVVRFRGNNSTYAGSKSNYDGFQGGTATFDIEGNIMSLIYGDNFIGNNTMTGTYNFCSIFKYTNVISAEHLVLPATTLTGHCYRAMFSFATSLTKAPELPATTLATYCYWYMFEQCAITTAPELPAATLPTYAYGYMFTHCSNLNFIKCLATNISASNCTQGWVESVASSGTFVKDGTMSSWTTGNNGIPTSWVIQNDSAVVAPTISYDGFDTISLTCATQGATIYYKLNHASTFSTYTTPIMINATTYIDTYATYGGNTSVVASENCVYVPDIPIEESNRDLTSWTYSGNTITTPYSVNAIDGHSSSYAKGVFNFETIFALRSLQPTYLWFQHADQSASIYIDNTLVKKHWGGYNAFFVDISNNVHTGTNNLKVALKNNEGNNLAPAAGDFNFNATLGNVRLLTSPCIPAMQYGYDGFHVTSNVSQASATIYVKTAMPSGASVTVTIADNSFNYSDTQISDGNEMTFFTTIQNPHLWHGTTDPHLYTITMEISKNGTLYHRYQRGYGLRYYEYVVDDQNVIQGNTYTGFLLNGQPYLLRGVCMHDDIDGKANALNTNDYTQEFNIIRELGCNFIRLAHYPHPKEVYDWCDQLGIIVQTEVPCVNKLQSTMPNDYYTHLEEQYTDMVNQHYNHPCIMFWGLSNETTTDDKAFAKTKIEYYTSIIKNLDSERMVGYVMSHSYNNPSGYYNNPNVDWFGGNIYTGWYIDKTTNDPTSQLNTRVANIITSLGKPLAFSEYGCGGTQHCHSEDPQTTTTKGNYERHDIEYQMWLHEGHIAAIRNFPQLLFTAQWQLFDIAVSNRNEGYTICLDGETTSTDDNLRRLNNKGLVERDHMTKKDTFYLYKAEWNPQKFVHICGKDYTRKTGRTIKCYTNDGSTLSLYVNNTFVETVNVSNNTALFTAANYNTGDVIRVEGFETNDTLTF